MKKTIYSLILAFALSTISFAQNNSTSTPQFITQVEGIKEYKLNNGLQVLLIPDQSQSNLVVNITYHVGSKHEGYGEKGMAHLLEHMLFKSTKNLGDIKKMLSDKGGNANGTTWYDRTNYYEIFPYSDDNLRWSIEMEADRMLNATLLQSDLDKEFSVVRNEFEIGENDPSGTLMEKVINAGYLWHNYGNSTIGSREDIERVKTSQLRKFYEKYYQPDNAVLVIAGKFEEAKALEYISKYFGSINKPNRILEEIQTVEPAQDGEKYVEVKRAGDVKAVGIMYHTAPFADKDYAAISVLNKILTADPSGYLYKSLVDTQKVANLRTLLPTLRDAGFLYFGTEINKDKDIKSVTNDIKKEFDKISTINYTEADVKRAQSAILKAYENNNNNTLSKAVGLTEIIGAGDYRLNLLYRDNIEKVTVADVKRVAEKYFKENNRTVGAFIPSNAEIRVLPNEVSSKQIKDLVTNYKGRQAEKEAKPFEASIANLKANFSEGKLSNGLKFGVINKEIKGEKILISLNLPVSNEKELANKDQIGELTAQLLTAGTKSMTKEQIKDRLDELKSSVNFSFNGQTLNASISTYKKSLDETMKIVKNIITEPVFPDSELQKVINENITYLEGSMNDPESVAFTEVQRMTNNYPKTSLFYIPTFQEQIDGYKKIKQADLVAFYKDILGANNGVASVVGSNDKTKLSSLLEDTFGKWNSKSKFEKAYPTSQKSVAKDHIINIADKENAAAVGAINFEMNQKSPDYPALLIANEMIGSGGFMAARIPMRLREKEGISYGAGSFLSVSPLDKTNSASWGYYAFLNPMKRKEVENAIKDELQKALKDGFTSEELKSNIASWKTNRATSLGTDGTLLSLSNSYLMYNIPFDDYTSLEDKIEKLDVKKVNEIFKKYIDLNKLTSVYTGTFNK